MEPPVRRAFQAFEMLCQHLAPGDARAAVSTLLFHRLASRRTQTPQDPAAALLASGVAIGDGGLSVALVQEASNLLSPRPGEPDGPDIQAELLGGAHEALMDTERRARGLHYTPRSLTTPIVAAALAPLLHALGPHPSPDALLALRICDPAMGSGAFLLEVCRQLGDLLGSAIDRRPGTNKSVPTIDDDRRREARLLIAQSCLFGVDRDPGAVIAARRSLALLTGDLTSPHTFLNRRLCVGDALVGVSIEQLRSFSLRASPKVTPLAHLYNQVVSGARDLADALAIADLLVYAHFKVDTPRERRLLSEKILTSIQAAGQSALPSSLLKKAAVIRAKRSPFHWELVFGPQPFDAIVGNPPFLGGKRISTVHGHRFTAWLTLLHDATKNADLATHFFRRGAALLKPSGTIGLIATNTIAQGTTRAAGLGYLLAHGFEIYRARRSHRWPGEANVSVAIVHLSRGLDVTHRLLDGAPAIAIDSRLKPSRERAAPQRLAENRNIGFVGCFLRGEGFILGPAEQRKLIDTDPANAQRIFPYLGGEEVNTSPTQSHHRYVIDFGEMGFDDANAFPDLFDVLRLRVKPIRDRLSDGPANRPHKRYWWRFANPRRDLREALGQRTRCLVTARVTKHLSFAFQPVGRVFSEQLLVFNIDDYARFGVLESRIHGTWGRLLSSSLGEGLRYTPSEAFETFPFPMALGARAKGQVPELSAIAEDLYKRRAALMIRLDCGLTALRDRVLDPFASDPEVVALRTQYEALDRAVMQTYGWPKLDVIPYRLPVVDAEKDILRIYEETIVDRLYEENRTRPGR